MGRGVVENQALARADDVAEHRLRKVAGARGRVAQAHRDPFLAGGGFRFDPGFAVSKKDQESSFGACTLDGVHHHRLDQLLEEELARRCLRHLDHRGEIELLDRSRGSRRRRLFDPRMTLVELCDLAQRSPAEVTPPRRAKVSVGDRLVAAAEMKPCRELVADRLDLNEAVLSCETDGFLVKALGIELPAFEPRDLCGDRRQAAVEVFRARFRPPRELLTMLADRFQARRDGGMRTRRIEVELGQRDASRDGRPGLAWRWRVQGITVMAKTIHARAPKRSSPRFSTRSTPSCPNRKPSWCLPKRGPRIVPPKNVYAIAEASVFPRSRLRCVM